MALDHRLAHDRVGDGTSAAAEMRRLNGSLELLERAPYPRLLHTVAMRIVECIAQGGKVLFCGNGGSAAEAQHLASKLVIGMGQERPPAAGLALTADSAVLTALAVQLGFEHVFARQVQAFGRADDILYCLAPAGRSASIVNAMVVARELGLTTVAFTGEEPRAMSRADLVVAVPAADEATIQALHVACGHVVFAIVGMTLFPRIGG